MILFFDRSIGTVVPRSLQWKPLRFPIQVEYHQQYFAIDEKDDILKLIVVEEKHYRLVAKDQLTKEEIEKYKDLKSEL